jgi:hypothetical protein
MTTIDLMHRYGLHALLRAEALAWTWLRASGDDTDATYRRIVRRALKAQGRTA